MKLFGNKQKTGPAPAPAAAPAAASAAASATATVSAPAPRRKERRAASGGLSGGKIALITVCAIVAAIAAAGAAGVSYVSRMDTIFPNVSVDGMDISGLTLSDTINKLSAAGYGDLEGKSVSVELPMDETLTISAADVCSETPAADIARMAWDACMGGSVIEDAVTYLNCRFGGMELESGSALTVDRSAVASAVDAAAAKVRKAVLSSEMVVGEDSIQMLKGASGITIDADQITEMLVKALEEKDYTTLQYQAELEPSEEMDLQGVYDSIYAEPLDAVYDKATGEITPECVGVSFDVADARRSWNEAAYGDTVTIPLIVTEPAVTEEQLRGMLFRDQLSTKSTSLSGSSSNRINNVRHAADSINGVILLPGEEFSYNPTLGERTKENGYKLAGAYSAGQTVQEYGGGICQVSSTLYYCALYANLEITSRTCHMFPVGYLPPGLDATVSWGGPEFKFVNSRDYPIRIEAGVDSAGSNVTVSIIGTDVDGSYVEVTYDTWYTYDPKYTSVRTGYKAQTYRNVYDKDGNLLSHESEASSTYSYHKENISYPVEATPTPAPANNGDFPTDVTVPEVVDPNGGLTAAPTVPGTGGVTEVPSAPVENPPAPVENPPAPAENPPAPVENPPVVVENPPVVVNNPPPAVENPPAAPAYPATDPSVAAGYPAVDAPAVQPAPDVGAGTVYMPAMPGM